MNTEVCEQLFSWLSKFATITKHMNRWQFLFLMLYLLDNHNQDVEQEGSWTVNDKLCKCYTDALSKAIKKYFLHMGRVIICYVLLAKFLEGGRLPNLLGRRVSEVKLQGCKPALTPSLCGISVK
mgnify:CR=1 FL=1